MNDMAKRSVRRPATLRISLTPGLQAAVDARLASGLYASASELFREALRLLLQSEQVRPAPPASPDLRRTVRTDPLATTFELFDFGSALRAQKLRAAEPGITDDEIHRRMLAAAEAIESDHVIRPSPERLNRLRIEDGAR